MRKRILLLLSLFVVAIATVSAQVRTVSGTVLSADDGSAVVGATVLVKGTQTGAATDANGRFSIGVADGHKTLVVSYIGMKTVEAAAKNGMKVHLQAESQSVDEVIVVAFGKQKRESFTGSAATLDAKAIASQQVSNPLAALNGRVAGIQMVEGNASTSSPTINVRGISSINAGTTPLIVLDGLPYSGYYSDINPADVESITVLKDAASTALYGARGANGVVLITTKQAGRGEAQVSFDAKWGCNSNARIDYETVDNPGQYYEMYYGAHLKNYLALGQDAHTAHLNANSVLGQSATNGGLGYIVYNVPQGQLLIGDNGKLNPRATLGGYADYNGKRFMLMPDDWLDATTRHGLRQEYNVSVNGGSDKFQTFLSLGYLNNEGVTHGDNYERYTGRFKADYQAKPWLRIGANISYTHFDADLASDALTDAHEMACIFPLYIRDEKGNIMTDRNGQMYDYGDGTVNGLVRPQLINENDVQGDLMNVSNNNSNAFGAQAYADISLLKDFKFTANASVYDTENRTQTAYNPYYAYNATSGGVMTASHYRTFSFNTQQLLNWSHEFGLHRVQALLGHEYSRDKSTTLSGTKYNFVDYDTHKELNSLLTAGVINGTATDYNVEGWFFRGQYEYDGKYFGSVSFRRDGSSRFHPDNRWGNFWSIGGAWIISKEKWGLPAWIDMLKVKASIGQQGNDAIGNYYYSDYYAISSANGEGALDFSTKGNPNITWETNTNFNAGIEFELFGRRLRGGVDFYYRKTSDMLMWFTTPQSIGYSGYYDNVGDMRNRGIELTLDGDVVRTKDIVWSLNLNLTHNSNRVTSLPAENRTANIDGSAGYVSGWHYVGEGKPVNTWYIPRYAGVGSEGQSLWYVRDDATGTLTTTDQYSQASYFLCDDPNPKLFGGFGTTVSAYGFDLTANFNFSIGGKSADYGYQNFMGSPYANWTGMRIHKDELNAWTPDNTGTNIPRFQYGDETTNYMSDRWLTDASYLAIRNISLGYTFPKRWISSLKLSQLRVFVSADNVAYFTKRKGFDPRSSLEGETTEVDYLPVRTISGGISVKF